MTTALPQVFDTVVHMLKDAADRSPASPAIVFENRQLDYGQYWRCVAGFAAELRALGASGQRVVLI